MHEDSDLLGLPAELRNRIYRYALVGQAPVDVGAKKTLDEPALLAVCKQIRNEALAIYYHESRFHVCAPFTISYDSTKWLVSTAWLRALDTERLHLINDLLLSCEAHIANGDSKMLPPVAATSLALCSDPQMEDIMRVEIREQIQSLLQIGLRLESIRSVAVEVPETANKMWKQAYARSLDFVIKAAFQKGLGEAR